MAEHLASRHAFPLIYRSALQTSVTNIFFLRDKFEASTQLFDSLQFNKAYLMGFHTLGSLLFLLLPNDNEGAAVFVESETHIYLPDAV